MAAAGEAWAGRGARHAWTWRAERGARGPTGGSARSREGAQCGPGDRSRQHRPPSHKQHTEESLAAGPLWARTCQQPLARPALPTPPGSTRPPGPSCPEPDPDPAPLMLANPPKGGWAGRPLAGGWSDGSSSSTSSGLHLLHKHLARTRPGAVSLKGSPQTHVGAPERQASHAPTGDSEMGLCLQGVPACPLCRLRRPAGDGADGEMPVWGAAAHPERPSLLHRKLSPLPAAPTCDPGVFVSEKRFPYSFLFQFPCCSFDRQQTTGLLM